jgi:hypothetical protein
MVPVQGRGSRARYFSMVLHWKLIIAPDSSKNSKSGAAGAPDYRTLSIFNIFHPKQHLHESRSGILVRGYELRQKLHKVQLQGKLTTPRRENRKILYEIETLKANEHAPHVYKLQIYGMTSKKKQKKTRETIPLSGSLKNRHI